MKIELKFKILVDFAADCRYINLNIECPIVLGQEQEGKVHSMDMSKTQPQPKTEVKRDIFRNKL